MVALDHRDARPLYLQVKDSLRRMMLTGLLTPVLEELKTLGYTQEALLQLWKVGESHA